jgi:hypothetical protein
MHRLIYFRVLQNSSKCGSVRSLLTTSCTGMHGRSIAESFRILRNVGQYAPKRLAYPNFEEFIVCRLLPSNEGKKGERLSHSKNQVLQRTHERDSHQDQLCIPTKAKLRLTMTTKQGGEERVKHRSPSAKHKEARDREAAGRGSLNPSEFTCL